MRAKNLRMAVFAIMTMAAGIAVFLICLSIGAVRIPFGEVLSLFLERLSGGLVWTDTSTILFKIRLPRVLLGFLIGGGLSVAGAVMQTIFRNPIVEPYTLGISGGAGLFVSIYMVSWAFGPLELPIVGFIGAMASVAFIYFIHKRFAKNNIITLLLSGIMFSFICSSLIMLIMSVSGATEAHGILFWLLGNLDLGNMRTILFCAVVIVSGSLFFFLKSWQLNGLWLGDEEAYHLGINVYRAKMGMFILASVITGVCVSVSGLIAFVGLVVPHFTRMFTGMDNRFVIPFSFMTGGIFLTVCDSVARTVIAPVELPVGIITGVIGGCVFLYLVTFGAKKI